MLSERESESGKRRVNDNVGNRNQERNGQRAAKGMEGLFYDFVSLNVETFTAIHVWSDY